MRINPGLHVLALSASARQFGLGPDALVLRGLRESDLAFLSALRDGLPDGLEASEGRRHDVPPQRARALTQALSPVLLPFRTRPARPSPRFRHCAWNACAGTVTGSRLRTA
ncbi:hypothetical protein OL239_05765 [Arthrobacter sp. ATA002]|uniref:hypothetical protein n=1 Tax=Arthrobacter sp. ATA002 TaxID=2991715 RepID=UPI0022A6F0C3|nr:hypothetical protein [Arthrobacter sp. ATA002]WAP52708.1 hypothetical protein OL239_05765 [Arthrobacter sp. ATA002]